MSPDARSQPEWDVIVVGAGPAGCAAAAAVHRADPSAAVLVVDRAEFPRDKACGDGIAFEVTQALAELGFDVDAVFSGAPPLRRLKLRSPAGVEVLRAMREQVHVVPREVFDARLVHDIRRRGIEVRRHEVRRLEVHPVGAGPAERGDRSVVLDGTLRARIVIGADGAQSAVRRAIGVAPASNARVALAIRGYAAELPDQDGAQLITMTGQHWPAYAWSFPIGDGRANVGYGQLLGTRPLNRAQMLARMAELLPGVDARPDGLRAHKLPLSSGRPAIGNGSVLLVGDAQSLINPLTGEGIYYAVTSGALAGRAAVAGLDSGTDAGAVYRSSTRAALGRHFRHTSALARLGRWPFLIDAGMRAARTNQGAFDDLVRFGLADGLLTPRLLAHLRVW